MNIGKYESYPYGFARISPELWKRFARDTQHYYGDVLNDDDQAGVVFTACLVDELAAFHRPNPRRT